MASELAQLESRTTDAPDQETEPAKEDVDFQFNGNSHLIRGPPLVTILRLSYR